MVYFSTAYSNFDPKDIDERIYDNSVTPHDPTITITECLDEATISSIEKKLVGKKTNTYTSGDIGHG